MENEDRLQLSRETLADRLTTQLRQQILSGRIAPGALMPTEKELAEAFGVGRTTVREALHGLVASGFLERRSNQLVVRERREIGEHDVDYAAMAARLSVEDLYEARKAIEAKAVELATRNWADGDITGLRAALEAMRGKSGADYHAADVEFHMTVSRIGKNAVLHEIYEGARGLFFKLPSFWRLFASESGVAGGPITGYEGHLRIFEAIERRDVDEAVRLNTDMLDRVAAALIARLNEARDAGSNKTETSTTNDSTTNDLASEGSI